MALLFANSSTTRDNLLLKTLPGHLSPDAFYSLTDLGIALCGEQDVSIGDSDISMTFVSSARIFGF